MVDGDGEGSARLVDEGRGHGGAVARQIVDEVDFPGHLVAGQHLPAVVAQGLDRRRLGPGDPLRRSAGMLIIASMLSMPAALVELPESVMPGALAVISLGILGMLATGFATILYFRLIQGPGPLEGPPAAFTSHGHMLTLPFRAGDIETELGAHVTFGPYCNCPRLAFLNVR